MSIEECTLNNNPSLCIPRAMNIPKTYIQDIFQNKLHFGTVRKIDIVNSTESNYKKIFIHFESWNSDQKTNEIKEKILSGKTIKIVYQFPWFWKCNLINYK